jgi:alpha-tubulin suppressor-like RCC1 family protein/subtilase family serine protease
MTPVTDCGGFCSATPISVVGISNATAIVAGEYHTCAQLSDGTVKCWGDNSSAQLGNGTTAGPDCGGICSATPVAVSGISTATAVAAGFFHTCAVLFDSTVECWGYNHYGQLGNGTTADSSTPVSVSGVSTATAVAAGYDHTCAVLSDSTVECWGANAFGQLGNGTNTGPQDCDGDPCSTLPVPVSGITTATAVSAGYLHTCAELSDGTVECWGYNGSGQLGDGTSLNFAVTPVSVFGISTATAVAAGVQHTCALLSDGTVKCWGANSSGQLGNGKTTDSSTPVSAIGISTAVAAGQNHSCALLSDGTIQCWGDNGSGQLGNGSMTDSSTPVPVFGISTATAVAAGGINTCAVLSNGTVKCWGFNVSGELGIGTNIGPESCINYTACSTTPVSVYGISTATAVAVGSDHSCAVLSDGTVKCWGNNPSGELGDGTSLNFSVYPVSVVGISTATAVAAGAQHTCALLSDGTVKCWGGNGSGQLGDGTGSNSSTPVSVSGITTATAVSAGDFHTCAVLSDGTVQCWGENLHGQLGNGTSGTYADAPAPVSVFGISTATAVSAGYHHTCAVLSDGTVECWGDNGSGDLGDGTRTDSSIPVSVFGISTATGVAAGRQYTCAVLSDGGVKCWGYFYPSTPLTVSGTVIAVIWTSSDTGVATINANGLAAGLSPGTTTLTATSGSISRSTTLTVSGQTFTLLLNTAGSGSGTVSGAGTYNSGQTATVSASANSGSTFTGWTGPNGPECATGSVLMNADKNCTANFTLNSSLSDLIISALSTATTAIAPGKNLSLFNTVKNQGTASPGSSVAAFHLSNNTTYGDGDDIPFAFTRSVDGLAAGASSSATNTLTIPATTPLGNYYICAMADSGGAVTESDETNNSLCTASTIQITLSDLIMTTVTPNAPTVNQGGTLSVTDTVQNQGAVATPIGFRVGFHLSVNNVYGDGDDVAITTSRVVAALGAGVSSTGTTGLLIPSSTPPGDYYVCAMADSQAQVAEADEGNNILCSTAQVTVPPPDLIVSALTTTTTTANAGGVAMVTNAITNQGGSKAGTFVVAFHLSTNAVYGDGDDIVSTTTRTIGSLGIGATSSATNSVQIPLTTPAGSYFICANADDGNSVAESEEGNNTACTATTVTVPLPDLVIRTFVKTVTSAPAGGSFDVVSTVRNQGGSAASGSAVGFVLSSDNIIGNGDDIVLTPSQAVGGLGVGVISSTLTTTLTVPGGTTTGVYRVGAVADVNGAVAESNEGNNTRIASGTITVTP